MTAERDAKGRLKPGQKALNPHGRPKKVVIDDVDLESEIDDDNSAYHSLQRLLTLAKRAKNAELEERIATKLAPYQTAKMAAQQKEEDKIHEIKIIVEIGKVELDLDDPLFQRVTRTKFEDEELEDSKETKGRRNTVRSEEVSADSAHDEEAI